MRISDWSSDVCSSDLVDGGDRFVEHAGGNRHQLQAVATRPAVRRHQAFRRADQFHQVVEDDAGFDQPLAVVERSEEHTSELQSLMRISYAVFCLKKKKNTTKI